jgi:hypothetical protein
MRCAYWRLTEPPVSEPGVAGVAGLRLAVADSAVCTALRLSDDRRILLFGTEGVTDLATYDHFCAHGRVNDLSGSCGPFDAYPAETIAHQGVNLPHRLPVAEYANARRLATFSDNTQRRYRIRRLSLRNALPTRVRDSTR